MIEAVLDKFRSKHSNAADNSARQALHHGLLDDSRFVHAAARGDDRPGECLQEATTDAPAERARDRVA